MITENAGAKSPAFFCSFSNFKRKGGVIRTSGSRVTEFKPDPMKGKITIPEGVKEPPSHDKFCSVSFL